MVWRWAGFDTFGTKIPSGWALTTAAISSSHQAVSRPLMRTITSRVPNPPAFTAAITCSRAITLASGATASSRSRITASQGRDLAFSSARILAPGMYSTLRRGRIVMAGAPEVMGFTGVVRNAVSDHRCKACTIFSPTEGAVDSAMTTQWLAGADGCRAGWIVAFVGPNHNIRVRILSRFLEIFAALEQPRLIAIDVPIGLPAQIGPQGRGPERAVRPLLGARQSSVFAVPSRPAIYAND